MEEGLPKGLGRVLEALRHRDGSIELDQGGWCKKQEVADRFGITFEQLGKLAASYDSEGERRFEVPKTYIRSKWRCWVHGPRPCKKRRS